MNDTNNWQRYYGEERVKRAELEVATDELVTAAEMVLACIDQPKGRDNSEHDGLDAAEALRKATAEVKEFNSATLQYVHGLAAGDLPMMGDLVMLVARLARKLRKSAPADELSAQALDYLNRNGLVGSPLREVVTAEVTREMIGAAHDVMPEPFDWCYEWDGPYGTRKFSAAPHNGARCDRSVALYNADQMRAYAAALSEARCAQLQAERDACAPYLKEGETPAQRIQREIDDNVGVLGLLAKERARCAQMVEALEKARSRVKHWRRAGIDDETLALLDAALTAARKVRPNDQGKGRE